MKKTSKKNTNFSSEDMYAAAYDIGKSGLKHAKVYEAMLRQAAFVQETFVCIPNHFHYLAKEAKAHAEHLDQYFGSGFEIHKPMNYKPIHKRKERK